MGVLACDRNGCENIMCDYYSPIFGYLCDECRQELVARGPMLVQDFMNSHKGGSWGQLSWGVYVTELEFISRHEERE